MALLTKHISEGVSNVDLLRQDMDNYETILSRHMLPFHRQGYYLMVGEPKQVQGWILHLSVIRSQFHQLMELIIPLFSKENIAFKIPDSSLTADNILDGNLGINKLGKIITIYPDDDRQAVRISERLVAICQDFSGPKILTDLRLSNIVYTRYGAFKGIIKVNNEGRTDVYIHNIVGQQIVDDYAIPFQNTAGFPCPFTVKTDGDRNASSNLLNGKYKVVFIIKEDPKGNVMKALYLKNFFRLKWCVIKQGRRNMWPDSKGRDMTTRLDWQRKFHSIVQGKVSVPKIIELVEEKDDSYLIMEFIKGDSLYKKIGSINPKCTIFPMLRSDVKGSILSYLTQILNIVEELHTLEFVHRDITPMNFIVSRKEKLFIIDNELAYSIATEIPNPPFEYGTPGFMSPQQMTKANPALEDDIYGFGALSIYCLTGLTPVTLDLNDTNNLADRLDLFIRDKDISQMITQCLASDRNARPKIKEIKVRIENYKQTVRSSNEVVKHIPDRSVLMDITQKAINGLCNPPTVMHNGVWQSRTNDVGDIFKYEKNEFAKSIGLFEGIAGVLHLLGLAHMAGFDISSSMPSYEKGYKYIMNCYATMSNIPAGYFGGTAGVALALATGIKSGVLKNTVEIRRMIFRSLATVSESLDIAYGVSGQGICALQCADLLSHEDRDHLLRSYLGIIYEKKTTLNPITSLSLGEAGVLCFMLEFYKASPEKNVLNKIQTLLSIICKKSNVLKALVRRKGYRLTLEEGSTIGDTLIGAVLCLTKAFEVLKDDKYASLSKELLDSYDNFITVDNLSQENGLSALGEIYLQAYKVFNSDSCKQKADWIANVLINTAHFEEKDFCYWVGNNKNFITADFMTGTSGIIHFLMRYIYPEKIGFRLFE
jgi:serine/threonine protein kinase